MRSLKKLGAAAVGSLGLVAGAASAQTPAVDVSSITAVIAAAGVAGGTIGLAVLAMHYGMKLYRWIQRAG